MDSSKSRRELFEEQLKDLQKDISSLSQKLSIPTMVTASRFGGSTSSSMNGYTEAKIDTSFLSAHTKDGLSNSVASFTESRNGFGKDAASYQQMEQVTNDLKEAYQERDEAKRRVEQLIAENEELKKGLPEFARIKAAHDSLKQDNDALRISLESSERIRNQQKELIIVLQKSNAMIGESSILSFNSMSSISHKPESAPVSVVPVDLLAQEHQQWLNHPTTSVKENGKHSPVAAAGIAFKKSSPNSYVLPPKLTVSRKPSMVKAASASPVGRKPTSTAKSPYAQPVLNKKKRKKTSKQHQLSSAEHTTASNILSHDISASYQDIMRQNTSLLSKQSFPALEELGSGGMNRLNSFTSMTPLVPQSIITASDYQVGSLAAKYALQREEDDNGRPPLYPPSTRPFTADALSSQHQLHVYPMGRPVDTTTATGKERSQSEPSLPRSNRKAGIAGNKKKTAPKKVTVVSPKSAGSISKVLYRPVSSPLTTFGASRRIV